MTFDPLGDHINFLKTVKRVDFWTLDNYDSWTFRLTS